jgi:hypothetical protein
MPATNIDVSDLESLGIRTETDFAADDAAHLDDIAANDPFMKDLLDSMEQAKPTATDLAKTLERGSKTEDENSDQPADIAEAETDTPAVEVADTPVEEIVTDEPLTAVSDSFVVDVGNGQTATIDTAHAQRLLGLEQWANGLQNTPGLIEAFAAVEDGRAIPVPREQYEQFQVWLAGGKTAPATATAPSAPVLDEYATDTERAMFAQIQELQAQQQQFAQQQQWATAQQSNAELSAHLAQRAEVFSTEFDKAATEYGLTESEATAALNHAANTRLVQQVNTELTRMSPTGQVISEADPAAVARATFDRAIYQIPALRDRVIESQVQARLDGERASITNINAKKNRAASLSSAPAAATTGNRDVRSMTPQEREAGIAAELRAAMSGA